MQGWLCHTLLYATQEGKQTLHFESWFEPEQGADSRVHNIACNQSDYVRISADDIAQDRSVSGNHRVGGTQSVD
jgi:hypothetical protein